jgi:hypothetical protein
MSTGTLDPALVSKVIARQDFLEQVVRVSSRLLHEHGTVLRHEVHRYHTYSERELKNFLGFSFYSKGVYSMYGGDRLKLWYHAPSETRSREPTLDLEWWDIKECTVIAFDESHLWQKIMVGLIANEQKVIEAELAQVEAAKKQEREEFLASERIRQAQTKLTDNLKRLKLV